MTDTLKTRPLEPVPTVERIRQFTPSDLNDLCDATDAAIESGGGFGWLKLPSREILERYWQGVLVMPSRILMVARLDGVICGTCQLVRPPVNNEAQAHSVNLTTNFVAPWARGHKLATMLVQAAENAAREEGYAVINLDVRETQTRAIELYERLGFTRFASHPAYAKVDGQMITGHYYYKMI
jgi:ribosomal protein S18 acetylase RimI-like enzyme